MLTSQKKQLRISEIRTRLNELSSVETDSLTDENRTEMDSLASEMKDVDAQYRAAMIAEDEIDKQNNVDGIDAEMRERIELRSKVNITDYLTAASKGRSVDGAARELQEAAKVDDGIPLELWNGTQEKETRQEDGKETRAITPAPSTGIGVNLDVIRPAVFAPSVAEKLLIDMPTVPTGTYATGTITTSIPADAVAKGASVPDTAGAITTATTTVKRIGSSLTLSLEDVAAVGQANFETVLRQHISLALSDELDDQMLNGDGSSDDLTGIFERVSNPAAPAANAETWTRFLAIQSGGIDGLWASELSEIAMLVGPETYRLAAATFQGTDSEESAASYLKRMGAQPNGFVTNKRMPDAVSNIQPGILCRKGRSMTPNPMRTAVCPVWNGSIGIDDIYSRSKFGERVYVLSVLVGDVILVQSDAYAQVAFRIS